MPAAAHRPQPVDLWLCGHHFRESRMALEQVGAVVVELVPETAPAALH
jgi:hypothetical protein